MCKHECAHACLSRLCGKAPIVVVLNIVSVGKRESILPESVYMQF